MCFGDGLTHAVLVNGGAISGQWGDVKACHFPLIGFSRATARALARVRAVALSFLMAIGGFNHRP
jgi:hypothetical protein